jgi:mono/diheme cytochrome c family protein
MMKGAQRAGEVASGGQLKHAVVLLLCTLAFGVQAFAGQPSAKKDESSTPVVRASDVDAMRIAGEQRFHANCGRCHAAPQKFPPRMMKTVLRHMRVRATITDEDMRLVLFYMTQ